MCLSLSPRQLMNENVRISRSQHVYHFTTSPKRSSHYAFGSNIYTIPEQSDMLLKQNQQKQALDQLYISLKLFFSNATGHGKASR